MRRYLEPGDPDFDAVFGARAEAAARAKPVDVAPPACGEVDDASDKAIGDAGTIPVTAI